MQNEEFHGVIGSTYRTSTPWLEPIARAPEGAPNIVFVVLDDVGFGQLGCYGSDIETPTMDALASGGLRYNNFHTTAMCSPTRACLLTGRNHHAAGMGIIADWCTGYPGYQGEVTRGAATLAEMLGPLGYGTLAIGKWHLTRVRDQSAAGPFGQWPLGRGFDHFYGFLNAASNQWEPELYRDNHPIPTPRRDGYHLTEDLVDQTIGMIRDQRAAAPDKPFFAYLALGACHSPHHAPRRNIEKYRGRYDEGWDQVRRKWFGRQLELGIVPPGTRLTPLNEQVVPWYSMTADERRLCARHQEVFAGFLDHTDEQLGRLVDYLEARGLLDNTLLVLLSDNGASSEGGMFGHVNMRRYLQHLEEPFAEQLAAIDELGSRLHSNNYPSGWGHAGNTPLKWYKKHTHGGGVRDPLIVHWPARIGKRGEIRSQFCHCTDIVPTVLDVLGIEAPKVVNGVEQLPVDGTSLLTTFDDGTSPAPKRVQYFELLGNRGIWADGWKAVTHHEQGSDFDADRWELYNLEQDFSESEDLAERYPGKVKELEAMWWREAERNKVLPLDDRDLDRTFYTYWGPRRNRWVYEQGSGRISMMVSPSVANRSYRIIADIETDGSTEGVVLAAGGRHGGYVLYLRDGRLAHEYAGPNRKYIVEASEPLGAGRHRVAFDFRRTGHASGIGVLKYDGRSVGSVEMPEMWPVSPHSGSVYCGYDDGKNVSDRYSCPFAFSGTIHEVVVEADDDQILNQETENHEALNGE